MNTTAITINIDPEIKAAAQQHAKEKGLSLNALITQYLKRFVTTKSKIKRYEEEIPNAYFKRTLAKARANRKAGKGSPIFTSNKKLIKQDPQRYMDIDLMDEWLKQQLGI